MQVISTNSANSDVVSRLSEVMKARNMNQRKFSKLLNVSEASMSRWLSGKFSPSNEMLSNLEPEERFYIIEGETLFKIKAQHGARLELRICYGRKEKELL